MAGSTLISATSFETNYIDRVGRYVAHVPSTVTHDNITGEETITANENSASVILAVFMRRQKQWLFDKAGQIEGGDAYLISKPSDAVSKDDYVYANGTDVSISGIDGNATTITVDTSSAHGLSVGDKVIIGATTNYDGLFTVASTPTSTQFTITDSNFDEAAETSGLMTRDFDSFLIRNHIERYGVFGDSPEKIYDFANLYIQGNIT
jgi:hypothetical protein